MHETINPREYTMRPRNVAAIHARCRERAASRHNLTRQRGSTARPRHCGTTRIREAFNIQNPCSHRSISVVSRLREMTFIPSTLHPNPLRRRILWGMAKLATPVASGRIQLLGQYLTALANTSFIPAAVIGKKDIGPGPKLVYSRLLAYAATNEVATNNRLAADLAVSPRSIRNYLTALKAAGLVEVRHHPGKPRSFVLGAAL